MTALYCGEGRATAACRSLATAAAAALVTAGGAIRMYAEETLLSATYPEYGAYRARTARIIPSVL